jgi:hypothetical protein
MGPKNSIFVLMDSYFLQVYESYLKVKCIENIWSFDHVHPGE